MMHDAVRSLQDAFGELLKTFGGTVIIHKQFLCSGSETVQTRGIKNAPKGRPNKVMFQFPSRANIKVGDVLQQQGSNEYWRVERTEDTVAQNELIYFTARVTKIDQNGNQI